MSVTVLNNANIAQVASALGVTALNSTNSHTTVESKTATITSKNSTVVTISESAYAKLAQSALPSTTITVAQALQSGFSISANTIIKDTSANINKNLQALLGLSTIGNVAGITFSDTAKATITAARSDLTGNLTDSSNTNAELTLLRKISSNYTLNLTGVTAADAVTLSSPSKNAILYISIDDTLDNVKTNLSALEAEAKSKKISVINIPTVTPGSSKPNLSLTEEQLKANTALLSTLQGDFDLSISNVKAADAVSVLNKADNILNMSGSLSVDSTISINDSASNVISKLSTLSPYISSNRLSSINITDTVNPTLTISNAYNLINSGATINWQSGVKINIADTARNIIAHTRYDLGSILQNAGTISITNSSAPELTLADAITLNGISNLKSGTAYDVVDEASTIAQQAGISGETILSKASLVRTSHNFTISDAKNVEALKSLSSSQIYSISDTAANILTEDASGKSKILSGAKTVTVSDTSANIISHLDQLEALAKAGKITDVKFTDTPTSTINIILSDSQKVSDADVIGRILNPITIDKINQSSLSSNQYYDSTNGHVYEYFSATGITFAQASADAKATSIQGNSGYLATITSQSELNFIENNISVSGRPITLTGEIYIGGKELSSGNWSWITGPEAGTQFWSNGAVSGQFANWINGSKQNSTTLTALGINDVPHQSPSNGYTPEFTSLNPNGSGNGSINSVSGYLVEYGD